MSIGMDALISIHPQYVAKILSGEKHVEFRKVIFKKEISNVIIYSTAPDKRIIGHFPFSGYAVDTPENIWKNYNHIGGIAAHSFFQYYSGKQQAYAIHIKDLVVYQEPVTISFPAPQSYRYIHSYQDLL